MSKIDDWLSSVVTTIDAASSRVPDNNGWYEIVANPLSKVGVFAYLGRSIGLSNDPDGTYMVYRPAEELSNPETVNSFRLVPLIDDHAMLGSGYTPSEQKGVHGVVGDNVYYDSQAGMLRGNIKIFSSSLQNTIENGKVDLSCGYKCQYDFTPGVYNGQLYDCVQRSIKGNHLALVSAGRMGNEVAVMDSRFVVTFDAKDMMSMPTDNKAIVNSDDDFPKQLQDVIGILALTGADKISSAELLKSGLVNPFQLATILTTQLGLVAGTPASNIAALVGYAAAIREDRVGMPDFGMDAAADRLGRHGIEVPSQRSARAVPKAATSTASSVGKYLAD